MSSTASSQRPVRNRGTSGSGSATSVVIELREHVDLEAGRRLLRSPAFAALRESNEPMWRGIHETLGIAGALGGYVPVQYSMHEAQEGFGRLKARVMVGGGASCAVPYVHMKREARAQLVGRTCWDLDMANCQPRFLLQHLQRHGISCPRLQAYVGDREAHLSNIVSVCGVQRAAAKNLVLRLVFGGSAQAWAADARGAGQAATGPAPAWASELQREVKAAAALLLAMPALAELKAVHRRRGASFEACHGGGGVQASQLAVHLQTIECECVRALVDVIQADDRVIGAIIYDGVHVERAADEAELPSALLQRWCERVEEKTGWQIELAVKAFGEDPRWSSAPLASEAAGAKGVGAEGSSAPQDPWDETWMDGAQVLCYADMKAVWERRAFKIVKSGNFVLEEREGRDVFSERMLCDSYKHLHYTTVSAHDDGSANMSKHPFISRWIRDPQMRTFKDMVFAPPPLQPLAGAYNVWGGFAVERYTPPAGRAVDVDSEAVRAYTDLFAVLCKRDERATQYLLDWVAQLFQQPSVKTGVAVLLRGEEGVGKNRATDLLRLMVGEKDRFLQTASPANTLYGRFTRLREGRMLIVVNEASGADSHAASEVIKDMITCDEFVSEGKGTNSYTMACFARFMFTTNNTNSLKVGADSRRFVVLEASSEFKGNTAHFSRLSEHIADPHGRYEFYRALMARDLSGVDWINDRPLTQAYADAVSMNLPCEHRFIKAYVLRQHFKSAGGATTTIKVSLDALFGEFRAWLHDTAVGAPRYETTHAKFGYKLSKMVWCGEKRGDGFQGMSKARHGAGVVYILDTARMVVELVDKGWAAADEV